MNTEIKPDVPITLYKVSVVVVTFNRLGWVKKVIDKLLKQTYPIHEIVVIDNCSTDDTQNWLKQFHGHDIITTYRTQENVGGAGGFTKGMQIASKASPDFIWIMDDDCIAEEDALEHLVNGWSWFKSNREWVPGFVCSLVKFQDTDDVCEMNIPHPVWDWPRHYDHHKFPGMLVEHCSFVSCLIHKDKIKEVGLPYSEYFIWFDDCEYTKRLSKGYPGLMMLDSVVRHFTPVNRGVNFSDVTDKNIWKFKYGARNEASYRYHNFGFKSWRLFCGRVLRQLSEGGVSYKCRYEVVKSLLTGLRFNPKIKRI